MMMDEYHVSFRRCPLELLDHGKPLGLKCLLSFSMGIAGKEVDFPSPGSFDTGPGCCTLWIGPATLSCIHSHIFYASPAQFGPVVAHLEAQTVLPALIASFGTIFFQTGMFVHQSLCSQTNLFGTGICFMFVYFSSHYIQYVVLLVPGQPEFFSLSCRQSCPLLEYTQPQMRNLEQQRWLAISKVALVILCYHTIAQCHLC